MNDMLYLAIMLVCIALTFGLVRVCSALMPAETPSKTGSKP